MTDRDSIFESDFAELRHQIEGGTVARERKRELPHQQIRQLLAIGFGTLRLPEEWGGYGWDLPRTLNAIIDLASSDPHIAHAFRGQFNFIEDARLAAPHHHQSLIASLAAGDLVGTAVSERRVAPGQDATLVQHDGTLYLSGLKYYTTGGVYSDWIVASGYDAAADRHLNVIVDAHDPGVEIIDDWDGFGQSLTGSGTTRFTDVPVRYLNHVGAEAEQTPEHAYQTAFLQVYLLSVIAGICDAVARDAVTYVQPRQRTFGVSSVAEPRRNPLVQEIVGELHGTARVVRSAILEEGRQLESLQKFLQTPSVDYQSRVDAASERLVGVYAIQSLVIDLALRAATRLFDAGGASATSVALALDRHWRNIRTIGAHNPASQRLQQAGSFYLNHIAPSALGHIQPSDIGLVCLAPQTASPEAAR
jgi:alkylation response protein AidB-like acyl-CoA dehydrogenase